MIVNKGAQNNNNIVNVCKVDFFISYFFSWLINPLKDIAKIRITISIIQKKG